LLHKDAINYSWCLPLLNVLPAKRRFSGVGDAGFEPATSAV
jgi:hypothetical protein